jgi:hypothetical protein
MSDGRSTSSLLPRTARLAILFAINIGLTASAVAAQPAEDAPPAPRSVPAPGRPIRVGVIVSAFTANGPHWLQQPHGYAHAEIAATLVDPSVDLYAVVEPDTEQTPGQRDLIDRLFPAGHAIVCTDSAAMAGLEVIVAHRVWNLGDPLLGSLTRAVSDGVDLVNISAAGTVTPGYTQQVLSLLGLTDAAYVAQRSMASARTLADHPILGSLPPDTSLALVPDGAMGHLQGTPLIVSPRVTRPFHTDLAEPRADLGPLHPLCLARLGKGQIIVCNWRSPPASLDQATGGSFYINCIRWLALDRSGQALPTAPAPGAPERR